MYLPDLIAASLLLEGITGSTAYGLATENSGVDKHDIYHIPVRDILGLIKAGCGGNVMR